MAAIQDSEPGKEQYSARRINDRGNDCLAPAGARAEIGRYRHCQSQQPGVCPAFAAILQTGPARCRDRYVAARLCWE